MQIRDVMTVNVETVDAGATVREVAAKMRELDIGALPVCDGGKLAGLVTDRDITIRLVADGLDGSIIKVSDVMTPGVAYCFDDQSIDEAAALMEAQQIRRLPIVDRNKGLVGMLSLGDLSLRGDERSLAQDALEGISQPAEPQR